MARTINCTFSVLEWNEETINEENGFKTNKAHVRYQYTGDITGESRAEFILLYQPDGTATFTALEHIEGTFNGKQGSLILTHQGRHESAAAYGECLTARGYESMESLKGRGSYVADASTVKFVLELDN